MEYEVLLEKFELLTDIQIAETPLQKGGGVTHKDAKQKILDRLNP